MSTTALQGLLEYLYGTLTPTDMRWVANHLIEHADRNRDAVPRRLTMDEVNAMIDEAEANIAAGHGIPDEEVRHRTRERLARLKQAEYEMTEAV